MSRTIKRKKEIGAFYTPSGVTRILSDWAIRVSKDTILEPSFGGCGFLEAARDRLMTFGNSSIVNQIYGSDIDKFAFEQLTEKFGLINISNRFILGDFLQVTPQNFLIPEFDAVLGNPPYISHHNMSILQKENAYAILNRTGIKLSAKASLWAYFLIHAISFVKNGGRMAWVLPGSFLNTKYANDVHQVLLENFQQVVAIVLNERIFLSEGAEERSIVILCDNKGQKSRNGLQIQHADSIATLEECISLSGELNNDRFSGRVGNNFINDETRRVLNNIFMHPDVYSFGDVADIRIGIVTGDNRYFVLSNDDAKKHNLRQTMLKPIVTKFRMIPGLSFTEDDIDFEILSGTRCLLVDTSRIRNNSTSLIAYLESYPGDKYLQNKTFAKRSIWHRADDGKNPDAFMSYMQHNGPRVALNAAGTTCTNSVHRVYFKNISKQKQKMIAISFISTLTQISAEIEGRSYGSGVLKQEPSESRNIKICLPHQFDVKSTNALYKEIDALLRNGMLEEARVAVDNAIYPYLGISDGTAALLNETLSSLRKIRQR